MYPHSSTDVGWKVPTVPPAGKVRAGLMSAGVKLLHTIPCQLGCCRGLYTHECMALKTCVGVLLQGLLEYDAREIETDSQHPVASQLLLLRCWAPHSFSGCLSVFRRSTMRQARTLAITSGVTLWKLRPRWSIVDRHILHQAIHSPVLVGKGSIPP